MKQLPSENDITRINSATRCAGMLMEVMPAAMRYIRMQMRSRRARGLSIPHFRTLVFLSRNEGATLSKVADYIGLTLPSASKIVDAMVNRKLVIRTESPNDRRYSSLKLTKLGFSTLVQARQGTEADLAEKIAELSDSQQKKLEETMEVLSAIFLPTATSPAHNRE